MGCTNIESKDKDEANLKAKKREVNLTKSSDKFIKIKSEYLVDIIFDILTKKKHLEIIKYNKNIQRRLNITINDYKNFSELYTPIVLELKPIIKSNNNKFIHISNKREESFYHIYFNDSTEEIKRYNLNEDDKVNKIKIIIDYKIKSLYKLFFNCECIESINFLKFKRINITNMSYMFFGCSSLKEIDFTNFNTNNVTNMAGMFNGCSSLKDLNINNFNTNNVIDMNDMFANCSTLNELNLSNFNTKNVKDMSFMFYKCSSLNELNIDKFIFDNVKDMGGMFFRCKDELKKKIMAKFKEIKMEVFD